MKLLPVLVLVTAGVAVAADTLDDCDARIRDRANELGSYWCFVDLAEREGKRREAAERLEAWIALRPDDPRPKHALAWEARFLDSARSVELIREAVAGYARRGDPRGEAYARRHLVELLRIRGQLDEADAEAEQAEEITRLAGDRTLSVGLTLTRAVLDYARTDYATGWLRLRRIETAADFDDLSARQKEGVFNELELLARQLGLDEAAYRYGLRRVELAERNDLPTLASALGGLATAATLRAGRGRMDRADARALAERALAAALAKNGTSQEVATRIDLASLTEPEVALAHLAVVERKSLENPFCRHMRAAALYMTGELLLEHFPERRDEALERLVEAVEEARSQGRTQTLLTALTKLMRGRFAVGPRGAAVQSARDALDFADRLAEAQREESMGVQFFSKLARLHYEVVDYLLGADPEPDSLDLAFHASERMRARYLAMQLARLGDPRGGEAPRDERSERLLRSLSDVQLALMLPGKDGSERKRLLAELARLELEEQTLRAERDPREPGPVAPLPLAEARERLGADQALLSFLLPPNPEVGGWLLVVTHDDAWASRLPERERLEREIWLWRGMLQRRDGRDAAGAARLYRLLLADALDALPAGIERLLIVPDGPLHRLPFDALRSASDGKTLAERFEISIVPSATVWRQLAAIPPREGAGRALFVADPRPPSVATLPSNWRSSLAGEAVAALPQARTEARAARRALGPGVEIVSGRSATEARLKRTDLRDLRLLHVAAHAIVDEELPERSAILLTPQPGDDDGLLQPREIVALRLDGAVITLSACRSVEGAEVPGEGVMGLARAFFQARARAVVGGLWPLHDAETAELMGVFYERLAGGSTVAEALTEARRELIRRGRPAAAWSGVVAIGATDSVPWMRDGGRRRGNAAVPAVTALALCAAALFFVVLRRRRRGDRGRSDAARP